MAKRLIGTACIVVLLMSYETGCWKKATPQEPEVSEPEVSETEVSEPEYLGTLFQIFGERIDSHLYLMFVVKDSEGFLKRYTYSLREGGFLPSVKIINKPRERDPVWILKEKKAVSLSSSKESLLK